MKDIAASLGVSRPTVQRAIRGDTWANIPIACRCGPNKCGRCPEVSNDNTQAQPVNDVYEGDAPDEGAA